MEDQLGLLVVTDLRVLFLRTGLIRRKTKVWFVSLTEIEHVDHSESAFIGIMGRGKGALTLTLRDATGETRRVEFERIPGGRPRAEELARAIIHQRAQLVRPREAEPSQESATGPEGEA